MFEVVLFVLAAYLIYLADTSSDDNDTLIIIVSATILSANLTAYPLWTDERIPTTTFILIGAVNYGWYQLASYRAQKGWGRTFSYWRLIAKFTKYSLSTFIVLAILYVLKGMYTWIT